MTILKADPETRRKAFYLIGVVTLIGIVIIQWGMPLFKSYLNRLSPKDALQVLNIGLSICFLSIIPWALYFYRYGRKIIKSNQCPPPGIKVIHDTVVHTGLAARRRGLMLAIASVLIMAMASFASVYFPYMLSKVSNRQIANKKSDEGLHRMPQETRPR